MKKIIIIFMIGLLTRQMTQAQGIIYVSSMNQTPTGSELVGNDSWYAALFETGNNVGGYTLDSIQLGMTDASGNPSGFTVMVYSAIIGLGSNPGSSLGTLTGSTDPATTGTYTYTDDSNITLSPGTSYYIVLTAGTATASGAYEWNVTSTFSPNLNDGWHGDNILANSSNGSSWSFIAGAYPLFALNATAVPEPSSGILLGFGGIFLFCFFSRRCSKRSSCSI